MMKPQPATCCSCGMSIIVAPSEARTDITLQEMPKGYDPKPGVFVIEDGLATFRSKRIPTGVPLFVPHAPRCVPSNRIFP